MQSCNFIWIYILGKSIFQIEFLTDPDGQLSLIIFESTTNEKLFAYYEK